MELNPIKDWVIDRLTHLSQEGDPQGCLALMEEWHEFLEEEEVEHLTMEVLND